MGMVKITDIKLSMEAVLKKLHMEDPDDDDLELIEEMLESSYRIACPKAFYKKCSVEIKDGLVVIDGVTIPSEFVAEKLAGQEFAYPYCMTSGTELDEWADGYTDFSENYFADQIKELYLAKAGAALRAEINETVGKCSSLNPGSLKEWPISGQKELFEILGKGCCGISLKESWLMVPEKSGSGIFYRTDSGFENCSLCPRENCPNRRAEYVGK